MSTSPPSLNRFLIRPQYSIYYRRVKKFDWIHRSRSDYAAVVLRAGRLRVTTNDNPGATSQNHSLLLGPEVGASLTGQSVELLLLTFAPAFLTDHAVRMHLIGAGDTLGFRRSFIDQDDRLLQLADTIVTELMEEKPGREIVVGALVEQAVVQLLRNHLSMRRSADLELSRVGLVDRRIRRSVELMHAQLEHDLPLSEIAAASYLSPFHFVRVFKKLTGTTPHAYLGGIRTARAQLLLAEPDLSITEISSLVGYSSPSHFSQAFRQATGLTPRAFRKALVHN
jgi:AraC family transcriptional regulator